MLSKKTQARMLKKVMEKGSQAKGQGPGDLVGVQAGGVLADRAERQGGVLARAEGQGGGPRDKVDRLGQMLGSKVGVGGAALVEGHAGVGPGQA